MAKTKRKPARQTYSEPIPMLRWIFRRGTEVLTCQLEGDTTTANYELWVVPHSNVASAVVETYDAAAHALRRHAEVAARLRESGWSVTSYAGDPCEVRAA
jgi:hypothetical protein